MKRLFQNKLLTMGFNLAAALLIGVLLQSPAYAVTGCAATAGLPQTINFNSTVAVSNNLAFGDSIPGTQRPFAISGQCLIGAGSPARVAVGTTIVMCTTNSGSTEISPGIYSTGVTGVGMRVITSTGTALTNAVSSGCTSSVAKILTGGYFNFTGTIELVRTTGVVPANAPLTASGFAWKFGAYNTNLGLNSDGGGSSSLTPSGAITLRPLTCTVNSPSTVPLPTVSLSAALNVAGAAAGTSQFAVGLKCSDNAVVGLTMDAAPGYSVVDAPNGVLSTATGSGQAQGFGIQILNQTLQPMPMQTRVSEGTISANQQYSYTFSAQYKRLTGTASPGAVRSALIYTFDYQ